MSQSWPSHSGTGIAQSNTRQLTPLFILASATTAAIFAFVFYGEWDRSLRLVWAQDFGMSDPVYLRDIGFYLFVLPFLQLVQNSLVLLTLGARCWLGSHTSGWAVSHSVASGYVATDPRALRHVIANTILLLTAWTWGIYLDRFGLLTRSAGAVFGAGYTDVHVVLPGLWFALGATLALDPRIGLGRRDKRAARRHTGGWWLSRHSAYCVGGGP